MADLCVSLLPGDHPAFLFQLIPAMDGPVGNPGDFTGQVFFGLDSDGIDLDQRQIEKHLFLYNSIGGRVVFPIIVVVQGVVKRHAEITDIVGAEGQMVFGVFPRKGRLPVFPY